jgi:hypothetical protein
LDRSRLLHRLNVLGIRWGMMEREGAGKGTFHEIWRVEWEPELSIKVVEAAVWGNTVIDAATGFAKPSPDHCGAARML